ncbi:TenA family protein [Qingshengfaniella alkalisoli]|uniref:TenA family protein n=1 Tax=Qingshengfaniella alkalisoli TaxID=2599296 RepID=A0A5B8J268_9RHOB|nr:TenA family protein [Qingshengfaniella alkalisoli]QDY68330.1 TenA family protein [Qingshengfaniella alkalisoli]
MTPDYGRAFALLRDAAGQTWADYTHHTFVEGLRDGTLPREAFLRYLVQDYIFLMHFGRAWALGVVKSETPEEMKACAATVDGLINQELQLHVGICAKEGLNEDDLFNTPEHPSNLAYTRYVMDAGQSGDLADLLVCLAPCVMGYGEIGLRLAEKAGDTPYREWIDTYASEDYQNVCREAGAVLDAALARRIGDDLTAAPRWSRLSHRFTTATRLEIDFWQMGLTG